MSLAHLACLRDRIRLAKTWHSQSELNRTRAGFTQCYPGLLWKNGTEYESGKLVAVSVGFIVQELCESRGGRPWAVRPNEPSGFRGRKD